MKKVLSVFVVLSLLFNILFQQPIFAAADVTKPELISIVADKKEAKAGETVVFTATVKDEGGSGIKEVSLFLDKPQTHNSEVLQMYKVSEGKYQIVKTYQNNDEPGNWQAKLLILKDNAGNEVQVYNEKLANYMSNKMNMDNSIVNLTGTSADVSAPNLVSITADKKAAKAGETVVYTATVKDEGGSGIKEVTLFLDKPQTHNSEIVQMNKVSEGKYQVVKTFQSNDEAGNWQAKLLILKDNAGNEVQVYNEKLANYMSNKMNMDNSIVNLTGTSADVSAPKLISITADKKELRAGETVVFTATVKDEGGSGVKEVSLFLDKPQTHNSEIVQMVKVSEGKYQVVKTFQNNDEAGNWQAKLLILKDNAGNEVQVYNEKLANYMSNKMNMDGSLVAFDSNLLTDSPNIIDPSFNDFIKPSLFSFGESKIQMGNYYQHKFKINVTDEGGSGLNYVFGYMTNDNTSEIKSMIFTKNGENEYVGEISYTSAYPFKLQYVTAKDNAGNITTHFVNSLNIPVTEEKPTTERPTTERPTTERPTTERPTTERPTTEKPTTERPTTEKPTTEKPTTERPTIEKPTSEKPTTERPTTERPTTEKPTTEKPTTERPTTEKPTTEKPTTERSTTEKPTTEKPTTEKPTTEKPTTERPTTERPTTERPTTEKPTTEKPTTERPTTEKPTTEKPTTERPTTERPTTEKPTTEKPTTEKPTTERPTTEKPTTERPTTERPTTEKPTTEKPTTERPTTERPTTERPTTEKPKPTTEKPKPTKPPTTQPKPSTTKPTTTKPKPSTTKPTTSKPKPVVVAKPVITNKYISNASAVIGGKGTSNSKVYAVVNNKVIGSAVVKNGKFSFKIAKQKAGTKISFYAYYNKNKSAVVTVKVIDKIAPGLPTVNKVTTKSTSVSGKGERYAKVYVYKGKSKVGYAVVDRKGNFNVKIAKQKKNTTLSIYLVDNAGNKGKYKNIKVS
ncbi:Ig-like domain-containing protein [Macrococcus capreoli]